MVSLPVSLQIKPEVSAVSNSSTVLEYGIISDAAGSEEGRSETTETR